MENKFVSLIQITNLKNESDQNLSEEFVRYSAGLSSDHVYRHQEISDIADLINKLDILDQYYDGFIYGYTIPQLNKEFDLLKLSDDYVLDIELKSRTKPEKDILKQLIQNEHYLKLVHKNVFCFTFVSSTKELYMLSNKELVNVSFEYLGKLCSVEPITNLDLDEKFAPKNILVSPLNDSERFLKGEYLLTENQENIKKKILEKASEAESACFFGLTGAPGTGKTLLLYDIAKQLSISKSILMVHSGILCKGHTILENNIPNLKIIPAKDLRFREIKNADYLLVDEAQRLYETALDKIEKWVYKAKTTCIISYDPNQRLSYKENNRSTVNKINAICAGHLEKLTNKIRTNKELAVFISCLNDLNIPHRGYNFDNVKIFYEPQQKKAVELAKSLEKDGYNFISFTPSFFNSSLDYQDSDINTHNVIGQEFDKVCMLMDSNFYYYEGRLAAKTHPNHDYMFVKLLYQGITRARTGIALIIMDKELLSNILTLFKKS